MNKKNDEKLSRFMTFLLRHKSEEYGLHINEEGFCDIDEFLLVVKKNNKFSDINIEDIKKIVSNCEKQRFLIVDNKIRANYGHSNSKIKYNSKIPPSVLYHGTYKDVINNILTEGIKKMNRDYVHMSESTRFAELAGSRHGKVVILKINTKKAIENEITFYYAGNEVWLSDYIPPNCIEIEGDYNDRIK